MSNPSTDNFTETKAAKEFKKPLKIRAHIPPVRALIWPGKMKTIYETLTKSDKYLPQSFTRNDEDTI